MFSTLKNVCVEFILVSFDVTWKFYTQLAPQDSSGGRSTLGASAETHGCQCVYGQSLKLCNLVKSGTSFAEGSPG